MDNIYLMTVNKGKSNYDHLFQVLKNGFANKYLIRTTEYSSLSLLPFFAIESNKKHINEFNEKLNPVIWLSMWSKNDLYQEDNNFPIRYKQKEYFPVAEFRCSESLFLLEFLIPLIENDMDYLICNANNKLLSASKLKISFSEKNYGWAY